MRVPVLSLTRSFASTLLLGLSASNFGSDNLYQITTASGSYTFGPEKQNKNTNAFIYDTIGNMANKKQTHTIVQPNITSEHLPKETNYVLNYVYGSSKPHAVTDAGDKFYSYDAAGNMTGWTHKTNGTRRTIYWNEENRVKQIDDNGKATYFLYDDAGERVVKRGQHGETIYVNRFYSVRNGELGTKHVFAGETRVVSKLVKTPNTVTANSTTTTTTSNVTSSTTATIPGIQGLDNGRGKKLGIIRRLPDGYQTGINPPVEKDEFFYHGDHLGSSNMITDDAGAVYQHLEYFPYGETWIEEGGSFGGNTPGYKFTGKELDPETGLYYYGARYYEPDLSRWISTDPAIEKFLSTTTKNERLSNLEKIKKVGFNTGNQLSASEGLRLITFLNLNKESELPRIYDPLVLSVYSYVQNNPLVFVDPDGLDVFWVGIGFTAVIGEKPNELGRGFVRQTTLGLAVDTKTWTFTFFKSLGRSDFSETWNKVAGFAAGIGPVIGQMKGTFKDFMGESRVGTYIFGIASYSDIKSSTGALGFEVSAGGKGFGIAETHIDVYTHPLFSPTQQGQNNSAVGAPMPTKAQIPLQANPNPPGAIPTNKCHDQ